MNCNLKKFAWYARLPDGIREFLILQLATFCPEIYIQAQSSAYMVDMFFSGMADLGWWTRRSASKEVTRSQIAGSFVNVLLDPLLGMPLPQAPTDTRPAPQLLATCKQAYREGHIWFYTHNTFYLPRGPIALSHQYFKTLQPHHRNIIQTLGIEFGLGDITQEYLEAHDSALKSASGWVYNALLLDSGLMLADHCMRTWAAKLIFARSFSTLKLCRLQSRHRTLDLDGTNLQNSLLGISTEQADGPRIAGMCSRTVKPFVRSAYFEVSREVDTRVQRFGWENTRQWLSDGAGGEM